MKTNRKKKSAGTGYLFHRSWYPYLWLVLAALVPYIPTWWYGFSPLDDTWLLVEKYSYISDPGNIRDFFTHPFLGKSIGYYRPVRSLFFMAESMLGGGKPFIYHFTNTLLHGINVMLIYLLLKKFSVRTMLAFFLALVFAVHPLHVFNVAWIPGKVDTLMTLFTLAAVISLIRYTDSGKPLWLVLHGIMFILALLTKESTIIIPVISAAYLWHNKENLTRKKLLTYLASWVLILAGWYLLRSTAVDDMARAGGIDPLMALANALKAIAITLGKWFIPLYNSGLAAILAGCFFLLAILLVYRFAGIINKKYALLGALWFILFLIVPAVFKKGYNEWWSYPADIGLLLVLAQMRLRIPERKGVFVAAASIIILLAGLTLTKNRLFKDETTFADHYIRYVTDEPAAYYIRGAAYMKQSRFTDAIRDFDQVIGRRPGYPNAYYSRGLCYTNLKDYPRAIADFTRTIETDSGSVVAYYNRGFCYFYLKEYEKAYADFIHYLSDVPNNGAAYFYRGVCEFHLGGYDPALESYQKARDFGFNVPDALFEEIRKAREQALSGQ